MRMQIQLYSDLCAGTGKGFAAVIDNDTAIDELGLPYIPARRLKGCLREIAAMYMSQDELDAIFGKSGEGHGGCLTIGDARLCGYQEMAEDIQKNSLSHEEVTNLFCKVISQTEIDDETASAKDNSLRFTRVVDCLSPFDKDERLVFECEIACPGYEEKPEGQNRSPLEKLVTRLHHIGYRRNRGLGAVRCTLVPDPVNNQSPGEGFEQQISKLEDNRVYKLTYTIRLESDLILPSNGAAQTMDYIPGTSILGALAGSFVKNNPGYTAEAFNGLFYSKEVSFGNLYPSDPLGHIAFPAPAFLGTIKGAAEEADKGVKNLISKPENTEKQYKPLKKDYVDANLGKVTVSRKTEYHNALNGESAIGLYTQECLCAGQYYSGSIVANGKKMKQIAPLLEADSIRFGRSKTAQYANCKIVDRKFHETENPEITLEAGTVAVVVLRSDVVLVDEAGRYAPTFEALKEAVQKAFGSLFEDEALRKESMLRIDTISGYNAKWNLKKPQFPVIKAGSCLVFDVKKDVHAQQFVKIGERRHEGYGEVELLANAQAIEAIPPQKAADENADKTADGPISKAIQREKQKETIIASAIRYAAQIPLQPAQLGRIALMCRESQTAEEFMERIGSIKAAQTLENAQGAFGKNAEELLSLICRQTGILETDIDWGDCKQFVLTALNIKKYTLRMEGAGD